MIRYWFFWVGTLIFLAISMGILWKVYPPLLGQTNAQRNTLAVVDADIKEEEQYLAIIKSLQDNKSKVEQLHTQAGQALPVGADADLLLLQLDGLLTSLNLSNASVTVPLNQTAAPVSSSASTEEVKPGSTGSTSKPIVKTEIAGQTTVTISGEMDYTKTRELLTSLRSFSRWNQVTGLDIIQSAGKTTTTLICQVFNAPASTADFSGTDPNFLANATKLIGSLKQYAATPNYQSEGSYGRTNPFIAP